ncbi:MAG: hypothetical protein GY830_05375 [Bacteroidetes bacterium]|nr:hypothetical protein [Bacteroidota bacterium]
MFRLLTEGILKVFDSGISNMRQLIRRLYLQFLLDMIFFILMCLVSFIGLLLLGISGSLYLGEILGSTYKGFFIIGICYSIIFLFFLLFIKMFVKND